MDGSWTQPLEHDPLWRRLAVVVCADSCRLRNRRLIHVANRSTMASIVARVQQSIQGRILRVRVLGGHVLLVASEAKGHGVDHVMIDTLKGCTCVSVAIWTFGFSVCMVASDCNTLLHKFLGAIAWLFTSGPSSLSLGEMGLLQSIGSICRHTACGNTSSLVLVC